jgi:transcription elongation factor Elf1
MKPAETRSRRPLFNRDGDLILPSGAAREFQGRIKVSKKVRTGRVISCHKCGHEWETYEGKTGVRRCHSCGAHVRVDIEATA